MAPVLMRLGEALVKLTLHSIIDAHVLRTPVQYIPVRQSRSRSFQRSTALDDDTPLFVDVPL